MRIEADADTRWLVNILSRFGLVLVSPAFLVANVSLHLF